MNKSDFFDQKSYLEILEKRTKAIKEGYRQNIAIIGDKDIGKSSVVLQFLSQFDDPKILPLYFELRPEFTLEQFVKKFIGIMLYNFLENSNVVRNEELDYLVSKASRFIPKTSEAIRVILNSLRRRNRENIFIQLLSLCDIFNSETGKLCVIIFDEFHHLGTLGIKQIYKQLSKMLMIQKNVLYIILSSAKFKAKKILSSHLALLFGNFEIIEMQPFSLKTTEEYLANRLKPLQIDKSLIDFLVHLTGGFPLYLKIITDSLLRISGEITKNNLAEIIQDLLFVESGILNQRCNNYLKLLSNLKLTQDYQALLYLIADGQNRLKDIATSLHKPKTQILSRLNFLMEYDVIGKSGDFFVICDRIFGFWLRFVYREKLNSLTFDTEKQKKSFRIKIEDKIDKFILVNKKSVLERTMELLRLFENELIQIRMKKIRLIHFKEVKPLTFVHSRLNAGLLGRSKYSLWIMAIKVDSLTEEDIIDFINQCQRLRYVKPQRKIIITSAHIDTNVRLKAMEEKVLTWDLDDLNVILDLYNKPRVVQ
jgi:DNA-binding NarL/FixJ family response regulator